MYMKNLARNNHRFCGGLLMLPVVSTRVVVCEIAMLKACLVDEIGACVSETGASTWCCTLCMIHKCN